MGKALHFGEARLLTAIRFLFGDWYKALSRKRHVRGQIVGKWFRHITDAKIAELLKRNAMKKLNECERVVSCVPPEYRDPSRHWSFYVAVSNSSLSEERRLYYLRLPMYPGVMADINRESGVEAQEDTKTLSNDTNLRHNGEIVSDKDISPSLCDISGDITAQSPLVDPDTGEIYEWEEFRQFCEWKRQRENVSVAMQQTKVEKPIASKPLVSNLTPLSLLSTPSMRQIARTLAEKRKVGHDHCRKSSESHGSDALNLEYEYRGVLAEMLIIDASERAGFQPQNYRFVANKALSSPDFRLGKTTFDVKAVSESGIVCINDRKHTTPKCRPDWYVIVHFEPEEQATIALVSASDVDIWERREGKSYTNAQGKRCQREPYRSKPWSELHKLSSWEEWTEITENDKKERDTVPPPFFMPVEAPATIPSLPNPLLEPFLPYFEAARQKRFASGPVETSAGERIENINEFVRSTEAAVRRELEYDYPKQQEFLDARFSQLTRAIAAANYASS